MSSNNGCRFIRIHNRWYNDVYIKEFECDDKQCKIIIANTEMAAHSHGSRRDDKTIICKKDTDPVTYAFFNNRI